MLIRFSDNQLAGLSIVYQDPYSGELNHLRPFFEKQIKKLSLPFMIVNCDEVRDIQVIYPDIPRERIEEKAAASKRSMGEPDVSVYDPYKKTTIVITSNREKMTSRTSYSSRPWSTNFSVSSSTLFNTNVLQQGQFLGNLRSEASQDMNPSPFDNSLLDSHDMADLEIITNFDGQIRQWDGQFDNLDDQSIQRILQDLMNNENDQNDALLQMVQTFDSCAFSQETPQTSDTQQHQHGHVFSTNMNWDCHFTT